MLRMEYTAEIHSTGGPGLFIFGRAEESGERLLTEYRGKVQLIYLDPPFGTGDAFEISRGTKGKKIKPKEKFFSSLCSFHIAMMRIVSVIYCLNSFNFLLFYF